MKFRNLLLAEFVSFAFAVSLSGCSRIVMSDNPSQNLSAVSDLSVGYQAAYRRAEAFAHQCHERPGHHQWNGDISGSVFTDTKSAVLRVSRSAAQGGGDWERFDITGTPAGASVRITVANTPRWQGKELTAAQQSVESGRPVCYWQLANGAAE